MRAYKLNNLRKAVVREINNRAKDQLSILADLNTVEDIKNSWQMKQYLTPMSTKKDWATVAEFKQYLTKRINKHYDKQRANEMGQFEEILTSGKLIDATISVEWKNNRTWGANPTATIEGSYIDLDGQNRYFHFNGTSISGCGYDKLSTAVAEVVNMVNPILRSMYIAKNREVTKNNRELLGYGSGYGTLPRLEGGVGVSCYPRIFKEIGYKFETVSSGKMFDVFKIS